MDAISDMYIRSALTHIGIVTQSYERGKLCRDVHADSIYHCNRRIGHSGRHIAIMENSGRVVEIWSQFFIRDTWLEDDCYKGHMDNLYELVKKQSLGAEQYCQHRHLGFICSLPYAHQLNWHIACGNSVATVWTV
jgi:hypothetical protein